MYTEFLLEAVLPVRSVDLRMRHNIEVSFTLIVINRETQTMKNVGVTVVIEFSLVFILV